MLGHAVEVNVLEVLRNLNTFNLDYIIVSML